MMCWPPLPANHYRTPRYKWSSQQVGTQRNRAEQNPVTVGEYETGTRQKVEEHLTSDQNVWGSLLEFLARQCEHHQGVCQEADHSHETRTPAETEHQGVHWWSCFGVSCYVPRCSIKVQVCSCFHCSAGFTSHVHRLGSSVQQPTERLRSGDFMRQPYASLVFEWQRFPWYQVAWLHSNVRYI